jgi:Xaa-Pro aminopeptidase
MSHLTEYLEIQAIAKAVLSELATSICAADTERSIAERAICLLAERGISETWYYDCPAFVLLGSRSCLSISGRQYVPANEKVGAFNLITIDLSPVRDGIWGDCARSFAVEDGRCILTPRSPEFARGIAVENALHQSMQAFVTPSTTFAELFAFGNAEINRVGFENLDFLGNLGHSIASAREGRCYIESCNHLPLSAVPFFTFEPHIRQINGAWGFKHEDIYYFDSEQRLMML